MVIKKIKKISSKKTVCARKKTARKKNSGLRGSSSQSFLSKSVMILIVVVIGSSLTFYIIKKGIQTEKDISNMRYNVSSMMTRSAVSVEDNEEFCEKKAYSGEITVSVWSENNNNDNLMLNILENDIEKLPDFNESEEFRKRNSKLELVDPSDEIRKKLKNSSEKNPIRITLKGYGISCEGSPLVSIETGDNIFTKI